MAPPRLTPVVSQTSSVRGTRREPVMSTICAWCGKPITSADTIVLAAQSKICEVIDQSSRLDGGPRPVDSIKKDDFAEQF